LKRTVFEALPRVSQAAVTQKAGASAKLRLQAEPRYEFQAHESSAYLALRPNNDQSLYFKQSKTHTNQWPYSKKQLDKQICN
jgi:hypothetical protein